MFEDATDMQFMSEDRPRNIAGDMPSDILSEKSLLGCLLIDGQNCFDDISELAMSKKDFYHPQHGIIYDAAKSLYDRDMPIDYVTLCSELASMNKLESVGGEEGILSISQAQASAANAYHYAKIVKDKSSIRDIIKTSQNLISLGKTFTGDANDYIAKVESEFFQLTNDAKTSKIANLKECLKENIKELEDTSRRPGEINGIPTGYMQLDKRLLGMSPGQLIVLAARPAMGKSALAMNFALNCCKLVDRPVAVFSLEMLKSELSMRLLSMESKVESQRLKMKNLGEQDHHNISRAIKDLSQLPLFISDSGAITVPDIHSMCRKIKAEQGIGLIIIDYLQLLTPTNKMAPREQQISEMSRTLKEMAKELQCPVIALSQLNRGVEARTDKRPMMSDLRESGAIEQDADVIMMIYRDEYYNKESTKEPGVAEVIIGKNRGGEIGTAKLAFVGAYTSFENLAYEPQN